jgi:hypothetical protein
MPVQLNHTIVQATDREETAAFFADILGLPEPTPFGPFLVMECANNVSLDVMHDPRPLLPQHYAFLVSEEEFDAILTRTVTTWRSSRVRTAPPTANRHPDRQSGRRRERHPVDVKMVGWHGSRVGTVPWSVTSRLEVRPHERCSAVLGAPPVVVTGGRLT